MAVIDINTVRKQRQEEGEALMEYFPPFDFGSELLERWSEQFAHQVDKEIMGDAEDNNREST